MKNQESPFTFVGNNLSIDFVNTEVMARDQLHDLLTHQEDLQRWFEESGLVCTAKISYDDLKQARELRHALKGLYRAAIKDEPAPAKALQVMNRYLAAYPSQQKVSMEEGAYCLKLVHEKRTAVELLGYLAHECAQLITSPKFKHLKGCCNPDCVLIFQDISKSQKRRWCSMETCGNRAKVAKHYKKTQPT